MNASRSYTLFRQAVLELIELPTPENVQRYLAASRILEHESVEPARAVATGNRSGGRGKRARVVVDAS
jgi:hypothetical protein